MNIHAIVPKMEAALERVVSESGSILLPLKFQDDDTRHTLRAEVIKQCKAALDLYRNNKGNNEL